MREERRLSKKLQMFQKKIKLLFIIVYLVRWQPKVILYLIILDSETLNKIQNQECSESNSQIVQRLNLDKIQEADSNMNLFCRSEAEFNIGGITLNRLTIPKLQTNQAENDLKIKLDYSQLCYINESVTRMPVASTRYFVKDFDKNDFPDEE